MRVAGADRWASILAGKPGQQAYMFESSVGSFTFVDFEGRVGSAELRVARVANPPPPKHADDPEAFYYSFRTTQGTRATKTKPSTARRCQRCVETEFKKALQNHSTLLLKFR